MPDSGVLDTARLQLVPFRDEFLSERYVTWLNDPEIVRYSEQRHRHHTLESCARYVAAIRDGSHYFWAVVAHDPALGHVGNLTATLDAQNAVADLAIIIGERQCRGQGYGLEAWKRACAFLMGPGGVRKVTAGTMSVNKPMLSVMRSAGMREEGRRMRQFLHEGREVDLVMAALFRD